MYILSSVRLKRKEVEVIQSTIQEIDMPVEKLLVAA
jgi:hypothetical protein